MRSGSVLMLVSILGLDPTVAGAAPPPAQRIVPAHSSRADSVDIDGLIDANNLAMVVTNTGSFAFDKRVGNGGLEFPRGSGKSAVFAAGLWVGAKVGGETRVTVAEYSDEYGPGSAPGGVPDDPNRPEYKVYKLDRSYANPMLRDAALADYVAGAMPHGAPPVAVKADGTLDILGDQMLWAVYNDLDPLRHTNRTAGTAPLGIEVQQTTFALDRPGALGNTIFIRFKLLNRGTNLLDSTYTSLWTDPDLGGALDDFVGCDTTLDMGFVYNADNSDEVYGGRCPAVGFDLLRGPAGLRMTSFVKYIGGTDPQGPDTTYRIMRGLDYDGNPRIDPTTGLPTPYTLSGDPVTGTGWVDAIKTDRRLVVSSGPFTLAPGDSVEIEIAIVVGQGSDALTSVSVLKLYDRYAQAALGSGFRFPDPPQPPVISASPRDGAVLLTWDAGPESYDRAPYAFEGYVVYQGSSPGGPWTRLVTFDLANGIRTVLNPDVDLETGAAILVPGAIGRDTGLRYAVEISRDTLRQAALLNGTRYFFALSSYAVGLAELPPVLESELRPVTVIPQPPAAGTDLSIAVASPVSHVAGPSTDIVTVEVVDPGRVIDATYEVGFKPSCGTCPDTVWFMIRTVGAQVDTVIHDWTNTSGDDRYPVVDGIRLRIVQQPAGELARVAYDDVGPNPPALDGVIEAGLRFFNQGADYAANLLGSSIPSRSTDTHDVEIRFNGTQYAYHYLRTLDGTGARVWRIQDYVPVPFQVWDLDANLQLNAAFLENDGPPPSPNLNGMWDPDDSSLGGREILWVMDGTYDGDGTPDPAYMPGGDPGLQDALFGNLDHRYALWSRRVTAGAIIDPGDKISFSTSIPSGPGDHYAFTTTGPERANPALAQGQLGQIRAVPNPYFHFSTYDLSTTQRQIRFTHLPARCTIRIFNAAGDLLRTIEKDDSGSQAAWDLLNHRGFKVGSGIFVFHVDAPGIGSRSGKMAIFMER